MGPRARLEGRNISSSPGFDPPDRPARSSVAIPTELPERIGKKANLF